MEWLLFCLCIFGLEIQLIILAKIIGDIQKEENDV